MRQTMGNVVSFGRYALAAVVAVGGMLAGRAFGTPPVSWNTDLSGLWTVPGNWSTGAMPQSGDDVTIDRGVPNPVVTLSSGTQVIKTLVDNEALTITAGTLDVAGSTGSGTMTVGAVLTINGGTLKDATLSFVTGGSLAGTGVNFSNVTLASDLSLATSITSTSALTLSGTTLTMNSSLGNSQSLTFTGSQTLGGTGTVVTNHGSGGGGDFIAGTGPLTVGFGVSIKTGTGSASISTATLINQGLISAEVSGNGITFSGSVLTNSASGTLQAINGDTLAIGGTTFSNQGTLTENGSTVTITATGWSNTGTINVTGGTLNLGGNFTWANLGTVVRSGGTINLTGNLDNSGQTLALTATTGSFGLSGTIKNGCISFAGGATLNVSNGTFDGVTLENDLQVSQATLNILDGLTLSTALQAGGPTINMTSGVGNSMSMTFGGATAQLLGGTGTLVSNHTTGGGQAFFSGSAPTTIGSGIAIKTGTGSISFSITTLTNQGLISSEVSGQPITIGGTLVTNAVNGTIQTINGDTTTISATTFTNNGNLTENGSTLTISSANWSNAGTINVTGGTLNLGGNFTWANLGTVVRSGGTINITGTLTNTLQTLALTATTGSFGLSGTIKGGCVSFAGGATLNVSNGTFDGVTLENDLQVSQATLNILDGLTLSTALQVGGPTINMTSGVGNSMSMTFGGATAQLLGGTGTLVSNHTTGGGQAFFSGSVPTTIGSGIAIKTGTGSISFSITTLTNQGLISSEVSGQSVTIGGNTFTNGSTGTVQAINGATVTINSLTWSNAGNLIVNGSTLTFGNSWSNTGTISVTNATLNLGGNFTLASSGTIVRGGTTTVNITGILDNSGQTLAISPATTGGSLGLSGTIKNGCISFAGGSTLNIANGTLDGVTLENDLTVTTTTVNVLDGLTLSPALQAGGPTINMTSGLGNSVSMTFSGTAAQILGGTGTIVFNHTTGGGAAFLSGSGTLTVGPGVAIITGTGSGSITTSNLVNQGLISSEVAGQSLTITPWFTSTGTIRSLNGGALTFGGNATFTGTGLLSAQGGAVTLSGGTLLIGTPGNSAGIITGTTAFLTVNASSDLTSDAVRVATWTVNGVSTVRQNGTTTGVSLVNTLTLAGTTGAWTGEVNLTNNKLAIEATANHAAAYATLQDQVAYGKTHAAGIVVTPVLAGQVVVVSDNGVTDGSTPSLTSFYGQTVNSSAIFVAVTYSGDSNLDGIVNIQDLQNLANHWQQPVTDWRQADFDGSGKVDILDLQALANHWQAGVGGGGGSGESFSEALALVGQFGGAGSVPEPGSLAMLGIGMMGLLRRRKR